MRGCLYGIGNLSVKKTGDHCKGCWLMGDHCKGCWLMVIIVKGVG